MGWRGDLLARLRDATGLIVSPPSRLHAHVEIEALRRFFAHFRIDGVVDVGANVGQYALRLRHRVGFKGAILSFEPNPEAAARLRRQAASDPLWFVEEMALSDRTEPVTLNVMANSEFSSLHQPAASQAGLTGQMNVVSREVAVPGSTLDAALEAYRGRFDGRRLFLKMDTQGHDLAVFAGAVATIPRLVGLQSEMSYRRLYDDTPAAEESLAAFRRAGFVLSALVPNNGGFFPDLLEMDCLMYRGAAPAGATA